MLLNRLKIALRTITRSPSYTVVNVSGVTLGIACGLLIFSLVSYHLSFDNFHADSDRVYRFVTEEQQDQVSYTPAVPPAFGNAFRRDYTFGEKVARLVTLTDEIVAAGEGPDARKFKEQVSFADPEFFDIFNFALAQGNPAKTLSEAYTVVITERTAKKYFGNEPALGKTLRFNTNTDFTITGVLQDIPNHTDFRSEIYFSYSTLGSYNEWLASDLSWGGISDALQTFVRLQPGITPAQVEEVLPAYVKKYRPTSKNVHHYKLQPLKEVHFDPRYDARMSSGIIWILSLVGGLLILTACLNFINLATAQAINRAKEVGIRKTLGSTRGQLFWQFTVETGVMVVLATVLAYGVSYAVIPIVNELFGSRVAIDLLSGFQLPLFTGLLIILVTLLSSAYPAMILSGFRPALALKGSRKEWASGSFNLRRTMVTAQFTISQVMLIGLIVVLYQNRYVSKADLGFNKGAIVMIPVASWDNKLSALKEEFKRIPGVESATACFAAPASENRWGTMISFDGRPEGEDFSASFRGADEDYLSTFDIRLLAGRNLLPSDTVREFLVNETLLGKLGFKIPEDILGRRFTVNGRWSGPIVGVISDFHDQSLRSEISPVFITTVRDEYHTYAVKINITDSRKTLAALQEAWTAAYPERIYEYEFLEDQTAAFYRVEQTMLALVKVFSFIALFISCLGLYGLVSFMAGQKTKEIGIRKIFGATVSQVVWLFGNEFTRLIVIAFFIAAPVGWWVMSKWLEIYAYKVDLSWWIFAAELVIVLLIVLITVGYRSMRAATANPVSSLRDL